MEVEAPDVFFQRENNSLLTLASTDGNMFRHLLRFLAFIVCTSIHVIRKCTSYIFCSLNMRLEESFSNFCVFSPAEKSWCAQFCHFRNLWSMPDLSGIILPIFGPLERLFSISRSTQILDQNPVLPKL